MATKNFILSIPLQSFDSSSLTASYQAINSGGIPNACESISIVNRADVDVTVSFDGSNDHNFVPTLTTLSISTPIGLRNSWKSGTIVSVKGSAGTGNVYLSGKYIAG